MPFEYRNFMPSSHVESIEDITSSQLSYVTPDVPQELLDLLPSSNDIQMNSNLFKFLTDYGIDDKDLELYHDHSGNNFTLKHARTYCNAPGSIILDGVKYPAIDFRRSHLSCNF